MTVTRNYGETANEKANELLFHLGLATISIVFLVAIAIGWREALVVAVVIPTTILLTLFASRVMGYTLNRVSLFALIFSIGILVDDAIVVIENIARHWAMRDGRSRAQRGDRRRRRGRQPDHRRNADGRCGASADALRVRNDGALHEPDSGQRLGRDAVLLLRRGHADALADDEVRQGGYRRARARSRGRRPAWQGLCRGRPPDPAVEEKSLDLPGGRRRGDGRLALPVLHQARDGEAAAVRQQGRAAGCRRPSGGLIGRGDRPCPAGDRRPAPAGSRDRLVPDLRRHGVAVQFQRPGASLLPAQRTRTWAMSSSISCPRASATAPATPSRSTSASASTGWTCPRERR